MMSNERFASRVFLLAGIYGILVLAPQYLAESGIGMAPPEPIRTPEHFYGFIGLALVWQFVFLLISRDVARYRPLMLIAVLEKAAFGIPVLLLWMRGRVAASVLSFGLIDLVLGHPVHRGILRLASRGRAGTDAAPRTGRGSARSLSR
jgi:hypothetical protein